MDYLEYKNPKEGYSDYSNPSDSYNDANNTLINKNTAASRNYTTIDPDCLIEIKNFRNSTVPGVWLNINKTELIDDMINKLNNPFKVDQGSTPFCGPGSIIFELVSRYKTKYVQLCQSLYETGKFKAITVDIAPSETLKNSQVRKGISVADWMLLASLRDTENVLFTVESDSSDIVGITTPWEMKGWINELLCFTNPNFDSTTIYGEIDAIREAEKSLNSKGVAFLLIDSALISKTKPTVYYPNHWVSYLGNLIISNTIKFDCYSWGDKYNVDVGESEFEDCLWGVVTAL
nr:hypothetical protein [Bacteroidota bacterium]